jgi:uncharacterized protein YqcC (DUF446 family)
LSQLLEALETELRSQARWESAPPSDEALRSTQPFAVDTLSFDQWLQWILLPRLHELLVLQMPLPTSCAIAPMAEEVYGQSDSAANRIVLIITDIDLLLTEHGGDLNELSQP